MSDLEADRELCTERDLDGEITRWLGRTWEVRATPDGNVVFALDGGSPKMSPDRARALSGALRDAANMAGQTRYRQARHGKDTTTWRGDRA